MLHLVNRTLPALQMLDWQILGYYNPGLICTLIEGL